jgi:hypothetical protein
MVKLSGTVHVALPPAEAFELFTPTGERRWAHGWDPVFPTRSDDETAPGTVFRTGETIWVVGECVRGERIVYARITPGDRAGLVSVECAEAPDGTTETRVTYTLTSLGGDLAEFAAHYDAYLAHWDEAIAAAL